MKTTYHLNPDRIWMVSGWRMLIHAKTNHFPHKYLLPHQIYVFVTTKPNQNKSKQFIKGQDNPRQMKLFQIWIIS